MSRRSLVALALIPLLVLHQDWWFWDDDRTLVLGFMPVGLAWHAGYTLVLSVFWWWAGRFAWPEEPDPEEDPSDR